VDHDGLRADPFGEFLGPHQLRPRLAAPDKLGKQQSGGVHSQHRHLMVVDEPREGVARLADGVGVDHHLEPVVAEARGRLEGVGGSFRIDGRG
jgi:hypothetical protein